MKRDRIPNNRKDELIGRYENAVKVGKLGYFEVDEFETIINHYMDDAQPEKAMNAVRYGQKLHPNSTSLLTKQARLYAETGETQKALSIIDYIRTIDSGDDDALLLQGEILLRKGLKDEATKIFDEMEKQNDVDTSVLLNIAYAYNDNRMFDDALRVLDKALSLSGNSTDVLFEIAYSLEQKERYDEAIIIYNKILDIAPYSNEAWFNLGQLHMYHEAYEQAIEAYDYAYAITSNDFQSLFQKANALLLCERHLEAAEAYEEYMDFTGESANTCTLLGECYEKMCDYETAESYYMRAWNLEDDNMDALTGLCFCGLELNKAHDVLNYVQRIFEVKGESSECWLYKAEAHIILDDRAAALESYLQSLSIDPNQVNAILAVANLYMQGGEYEIALEYFQKAKRLQNNLEGISIPLSIIFYKLKDYTLCAKYFNESKEAYNIAAEAFLEYCPEALEDPNITDLIQFEN